MENEPQYKTQPLDLYMREPQAAYKIGLENRYKGSYMLSMLKKRGKQEILLNHEAGMFHFIENVL